jgi:hypothetical protein
MLVDRHSNSTALTIASVANSVFTLKENDSVQGGNVATLTAVITPESIGASAVIGAVIGGVIGFAAGGIGGAAIGAAVGGAAGAAIGFCNEDNQ